MSLKPEVLPRVIALSKLDGNIRLTLGALALSSVLFVLPSLTVITALGLVLGAISLLYSELIIFLVGSVGQVTADGPRLIHLHFTERSKWILLDLFSIAFGILFTQAALDGPHPLFVLSFCCNVISVFNGTLQDQFILDCDDETFVSLMEKIDLSPKELMREKRGKTVRITPRSPKLQERISKLPEYSWLEIQKHNKANDIWVVADNIVYDLTTFLPRHPGGRKVLLTMGGRDATDVLEVYHPSNVFDSLPKYMKGRVISDADSQTSTSASDSEEEDIAWKSSNSSIMDDYRKARQLLLKLNLFETDLDYYTTKFLMNGVLLAVAVYLNFCKKSVVSHMISAALVGVVWQQTAFIGHDLGHTAVSHNRNVDYKLGSGVGCLLGGISVGWWKYTHNVHHINCNSVHDDPDVQHMPVLAVNNSMLNSFFSRFHEKVFVFDNVAKFLLSYQHYLFYPVMAVARVNLYLQSILFFWYQPQYINGLINYDSENKFTEVFCMIGFFSWYGVLLYNIPTAGEKACYFFLTHAVAGVLHIQICISHFSMKTYAGQYKDHVEQDLKECLEHKEDGKEVLSNALENWFLLQMKTTMDVDCPRYMDFFHGGLQYQVEHHLFPRIPRHNERLAQALVKGICKKHNVPYISASFVEANKALVKHLQITALEARKKQVDPRDFSGSELMEAMNLIG